MAQAMGCIHEGIQEAIMTEPKRHDWPTLIADLRCAGMSYYKIALSLGVDHKTIRRWGNGVEPLHIDGERLLCLHAEMMAPRETMGETPLSRSPIECMRA